jgi:hypothetical protein
MNNDVERAIQRIMSIENWNSMEPEKMPSYKALASEYLRRLVLWCRAFDVIDKWPRFYFAQSSIFDNLKLSPTTEEALELHLSNQGNWQAKLLCFSYIRWEAMKNDENIKKFNLPDLYEPLIIFFERGGFFKIDHGGFLDEVCLLTSNWKDYDSKEPFVELTEETLNRLDAEGIISDRIKQLW